MSRIAAITLFCLSPLALRAQEGWSNAQPNVDATPEFVFEGDVDYVDPVLRDDIGPPRVLSGTMKLEAYPKLDYSKVGLPDAQLPSMIVSGAEFTLDRNYVLSYEAWTVGKDTHVGTGSVIVTDGEAKEEDDTIVIYFRVSGLRMSNGYIAHMAAISLTDDSGDMVDSTEPFYTAPAYKEATFELIFVNETGQEAKATGVITLFANLESDVTPQQDYQQLEEQIRELDQKLADKEKLVSNLRAQLNLKDVDLAKREEQIANLQAENEKLATEAEQLRNGEALKVMEQTNAKLLDKLEESQEAREFSAASVAQMTVRQEFLAKDNAELAQSNTKLREELAAALSDLGEMRNAQEMLARQANKSFQYSLPPLPPPASDTPAADTKTTSEKPQTAQSTPSVATTLTTAGPGGLTLEQMAMAAAKGPGVQRGSPSDLSTPPGITSDARDPGAGVISGQPSAASLKFPLPTVARQGNTQLRRQPAVASINEDVEADEDSTNRVPRRGPRR